MSHVADLKWFNLLRIDSKWIEDYLITHKTSWNGKLTTRAYSLRFMGTEENMQSLIEFMADRIIDFVLSKTEIEECEKKGVNPWRIAAKYFGDTDPTSEGKYGELLLFLFVESVLETPMVAHKIKSIGDNNDQVKGSDGVFFGNYNGVTSLLLGESKVSEDRNRAINKSLKSVDKFHNSTSAQEMIKELSIIRKTLTDDLTTEQLDFLLKILDVKSTEYQTVNKVHPVLIVYDENKISEIEIKCLKKEDGEKMVCAEFAQLSDELLPKIIEKIETNWEPLKKIFLDFFFVPVTSVDKFRESMYKAIHHTSYKR